MKFLRSIILICSVLFLSPFAYGQNENTLLLKVGDKAPALLPYKWIKGTPVSEFKKNHVYIIEFGATWCVPCAAAIPHLTSLAKKYEGKATVVSLFVMELNKEPLGTKDPAYVAKVERYVAKQGSKMEYNVAVDDPQKTLENSWLRAAGKNGIPFTFVINKNGVIAWIGSNMSELDGIVQKNIDGKSDRLVVTKQMWDQFTTAPYDQEKLLLIDGNGGKDDDFSFRSLIRKYKGDIKTGSWGYVQSFFWAEPGSAYEKYKGRVQEIGMPLEQLYYMAYSDTTRGMLVFRNLYSNLYPDTIKNPQFKTSYGKYWHVPVLEVSDQTPFKWSYRSIENKYDYSLKVPVEIATAKFLQETMQRDLNTYFGYDVKVETRMMPYWRVIVRDKTTVITKLITKTPGEKCVINDNDDPFFFTNAIMRDIIWTLASWYGYGSYDYGKLPKAEQAAFIDGTGITEEIDFKFDKSWSFEDFRKYLQSLGLDVVKDKKPMKVVVIRDPVSVTEARKN
jgi:thiol-disulfide isomerase/thioredoxin